MSRTLLHLAACCWIVMPFAATVIADPTLAPTDGIVVLRNGQVIEGRVTLAGDYYFVYRPGSEMRLKASDVDLVCKSLDEAYQRKRERLDRQRIEPRLDLAQWCIRHELFGNAARELLEARRLEPRHPKIALIERQLEVARSQRSAPQAIASSAQPQVTNEDLERLVRGLPAGAVETFTNTIQPLLINACSTSSCHGPAANNNLALLRPSSLGATRRMTQRNLYKVMQFIDPDESGAIPLLQYATQAHGTAKGPPLSTRDVAAYRELVVWVQRVSAPQTVRAKEPGKLDAVAATPLATTPTPNEAPGDVRQVTFEAPALAAPPQAPMQIQKLEDRFQFDPLDPARFNERFHKSAPIIDEELPQVDEEVANG